MKLEFDESDIPKPLRGYIQNVGGLQISYDPQHETGTCERCNTDAVLRPYPVEFNGGIQIVELCEGCQSEAVDVYMQMLQEQAEQEEQSEDDVEGGGDAEFDISEELAEAQE